MVLGFWRLHSYSKPGTFNISVTVIDSKGQSDTDYSKAFIGKPPDTPSITGPTNCKPYKWYSYTIVADDPDGGLLYYEINWGDGVEKNIGPFPAGEEIILSHSWDWWWGTIWIQVRAIDEAGFESDWAYLEIQIPRDKTTSNMLLLRILERFPLLQKLLLFIK
jgi:hypothetical protein